MGKAQRERNPGVTHPTEQGSRCLLLRGLTWQLLQACPHGTDPQFSSLFHPTFSLSPPPKDLHMSLVPKSTVCPLPCAITCPTEQTTWSRTSQPPRSYTWSWSRKLAWGQHKGAPLESIASSNSLA